MVGRSASNTYSDFSIRRILRQFRSLRDADLDEGLGVLHEAALGDIDRITQALGTDRLEGAQILEVGPGQAMERAYLLGKHNSVTAIDLDVIVDGINPLGYIRMARSNGIGRMVKTLGRNLLFAPKARKQWAKEIGAEELNPPARIQGDFCDPELAAQAPSFGSYDVAVSWSVFEHLPDARAAVANLAAAIRPGGVALTSIHNYTAINGHHDIRAFAGTIHSMPYWGHLRPDHRHEIHPSAWLNELRIGEWQEIFDEFMPGAEVFYDKYEHPEVYGPLLVGELRDELSDYSDDELLTVNMVVVWRKPD